MRGKKGVVNVGAVPPLKRFRPIKIAIIFVILLFAVGIPMSYLLYAQMSFDSAYESVTKQVDLCLENSLKTAVPTVAIFGGQTSLADDAFRTDQYAVNYFYKDGSIIIPNAAQLAENLEEYIALKMEDCFSNLVSEDIKFVTEPVKIKIDLTGKVTATLSSKITVQATLTGREYTGARAELDVDTQAILVPLMNIVGHVVQQKGVVDVEILKNAGYSVSYQTFEDRNVIVFLVKDDDQKVGDITYAMAGAVQVI